MFRRTKNLVGYAAKVLSVCDHFRTLCFNPLSANPTKWSNTLKQFICNLSTNCFSVFDHFAGLALKGLKG